MSNTVKAYIDIEGDICYAYNGEIYPFSGNCVDPEYISQIIDGMFFSSYGEDMIKFCFPKGLENHYIGEYDIDGNLVE